MKLLTLFLLIALASSAFAVNIIVRVKPTRDSTLSALRSSALPRSARRQAVYDDLTSLARDSQAKVLLALEEKNVKAKSFWISNSIFIEDASEEIMGFLAARDDVIEVRAEKYAHLIGSVGKKGQDVVREDAITWSVDQINAPVAWTTSTGRGIVVANIDTGVRYTHTALLPNYRGNSQNSSLSHDYNWFDSRGTTAPSDGNGHGTHTMGTIAGSEASGVGVAPGITWFAAKGCGTALCSEADLTGSAEFVLCPTRLDGSAADCSKGADVVSNSWGGGNGDDWYKSYVDAWRAAGMIPVFAQGNSGPNCATANSPGDLDSVIGVGATDNTDALARFSSRGPGPSSPGFKVVKPDISAPGAQISSASSSGDNLYASLSGTSMACPSVAGVVALILGANPNLTYEQVYTIVVSTPENNLPAPLGGDQTCGGIHYSTYPNNHYGYGRIDAAAAVSAALRV